jgi:hypothetical protein
VIASRRPLKPPRQDVPDSARDAGGLPTPTEGVGGRPGPDSSAKCALTAPRAVAPTLITGGTQPPTADPRRTGELQRVQDRAVARELLLLWNTCTLKALSRVQ